MQRQRDNISRTVTKLFRNGKKLKQQAHPPNKETKNEYKRMLTRLRSIAAYVDDTCRTIEANETEPFSAEGRLILEHARRVQQAVCHYRLSKMCHCKSTLSAYHAFT